MSYKKSGTKQSIRNLIFRTFIENPPKVKGRPYHVVTLPGTPAFQERNSLERLLRTWDPSLQMVGLEHDNQAGRRLDSWYNVRNLHRRHKGLLNGLLYWDIGRYYQYPVMAPLDLVFEDRCGGATRKVIWEDWPALFCRELLSDGAYVGVTLCESPRIQHHVWPTDRAMNRIVEICGEQKLGVELIKHQEYDNGILNAYKPGRANPMVFFLMRVTHQ